MNDQQEREAFEAAIRELDGSDSYLVRDGEEYEDHATCRAWSMWNARAALAANVPAGWKLVPEKPTPAMIEALRVATRRDWPSDEVCCVRYAAMLAAAPTYEESSVDSDDPKRRCGGPGCDGNCCQPAPEASHCIFPACQHNGCSAACKQGRGEAVAEKVGALMEEGQAAVRKATPAQAQQADDLTGCACRWNGAGEQVEACKLHAAHKEAIRDWAERAKTAEAKLAEAKPLTDYQACVLLGEAGVLTSDSVKATRVIETACAEAWGVKLAGIGGSTGGKP